jgi:hypothetical protein
MREELETLVWHTNNNNDGDSTGKKNSKLAIKKLPRTGDGIVFFRADGGRLHKEHVVALMGYADRLNEEGKKKAKIGEKYFRRFWEELKVRGTVAADVPSPYYEPERSTEEGKGGGGGNGTEKKFLVCKEVFARLM